MRKINYIKSIVSTTVIMLLVSTFGLIGPYYASNKSRAIAESTLPSLAHLATANQNRGQAFLHLILAVNTDDPAVAKDEAEKIRNFSNQGVKAWAAFSKTIQTKENQELFEDLMAERNTYINVRNETLAHAIAGDKKQASQLLTEKLFPLYTQYIERSQMLVTYTKQQGLEQVEFIRTISLWSQVLAVASSIILFGFGFILGFTR